jgi:mono/diheme cytochrome c family protein
MFIGLLLIVPAVRANDTPRKVWVEARCALCHGLDGSSQTDAGRQTNAPDLRAPEIQKRTDEALAKIISAGHKHMPSFEKQVNVEKVRLLIEYIRGFAKK